ncbi:MAG: hypothetical protein GXO90_02160, partial [FCB group bacterium]|nr:hypothetical protein [FCB group bacterium]
MKRLLIVTLITFQTLFTQTVERLEYFIDIDPGVGQATAVSITPGASIDLDFSVDLASVSGGFHYIGFRTQDNNSVWSYTTMKRFWKVKKGAEITALEYFIDTDLGTGAGNALSVTPGVSVDENLVIPLSGLAQGFHYLGIRARDDDGGWSLTTLKSFLSAKKGTNVRTLEYFIDTDPGIGSAHALSVTSGADV